MRQAVPACVTFSMNGASGLGLLSAGVSLMSYDAPMTRPPEVELPVKRSIALVIRDPRDPGRVLTVLRPADDEDLPNVWGLPAGSLRGDESWQDAVERAALQKLGVRVVPGAVLNEGSKARARYRLHMRLYEATLAEGEPRLDDPANPGTRYVDWKWGDAATLQPAAEQGSLCCRLFLEAFDSA
jgi:8-oxo-dGTP pyrophosphatase MutT (NUDIX family)